MNVNGTDISMIRGDSETITITCRDKKGVLIPFEDGDIVYLTVKKNIRESNKVFQKIVTTFDDGKAIIRILPSDTKGVSPYKYVYDIELNKSDGTVTTLVPPSTFEIVGDVTNE